MTTIYVSDKDQLPDRQAHDHYQTESNLIQAALRCFGPARATRILDIGAGDGRWGRLAMESIQGTAYLDGIDIRKLPKPSGFSGWYCADFLTWYPEGIPAGQPPKESKYDLIVSNPPYHIAEPIIKRAWQLLAPGGTMIMLLRLAFQAGVNRYRTLWRYMPPVKVGVCSRRPSFYGNGTNGTDYGVFAWGKDDNGQCAGTPHKWQTILLTYERGRRD